MKKPYAVPIYKDQLINILKNKWGYKKVERMKKKQLYAIYFNRMDKIYDII